MIVRASLLCLLAATAVQAAQPGPAGAPGTRPPRYIEPAPFDFNEREGWQSMFDGQTLGGWDGPPGIWRVENGAIVTSDMAANPTPLGSVYMVWTGNDGGDLKNFAFKTEIKLEGERANSGIQFRAQMLGKTEKLRSEWESFGYQADFDYGNEQTGALIECCSGPRRGPSPRPFRASMGMSLLVTPQAPGAGTLLGRFADAEALRKTVHTGDWNQLYILVRDRTMLYFLNGQLMSTLVDDDPARALSHGRLLIQLEGNGDRKVSYRNMWLRKLD